MLVCGATIREARSEHSHCWKRTIFWGLRPLVNLGRPDKFKTENMGSAYGRPALFAEWQTIGNIGKKVEDHRQNKIRGEQLHPFKPVCFSVRGDLTCD